MRRHLWPVLLILGAVIAVYSNALKNSFVWDDHVYIEQRLRQDPANLRVLLDWRYYLGTHEGARRSEAGLPGVADGRPGALG